MATNLETKLFAIANELRGSMDANEYKNYILGFIFYRYLSEKQENYLNNELKSEGITFQEAWEDESLKADLQEDSIETLGYFITPEHLFSSIIEKCKVNEPIRNDLKLAFNEITNSSQGTESQDDFDNLFDSVDLDSLELGQKNKDRNRKISDVLLLLNEVDFELDNDESDILGDAYEYLLKEFASEAGKKGGEFYTPQEVSKVLAKIVTLGKDKIKNVYDPTCGSGSLLLRISKEARVANFYGQEKNTTTYNLARMNMILHGIKYTDFDIKLGDTIEAPQHKDMKFDAIVANPPYSQKWSANESFLDDSRFSGYGKLAPKSYEEYAFVQHMIYHLSENGTMAVVLPLGVLFRGSSEATIRKHLVAEKNYLDAVIGMPPNLFFGTPIPTCVLVFKKCREEDQDILFIDGSKGFEKVRSKNKLRNEDIEKIVYTYANREEIEKYSHKASLEEIEENDYNLNIPRYVDTFEEEEPIDLEEVVNELDKIDLEMRQVDGKIKEYCDELCIRAPISLR